MLYLIELLKLLIVFCCNLIKNNSTTKIIQANFCVLI